MFVVEWYFVILNIIDVVSNSGEEGVMDFDPRCSSRVVDVSATLIVKDWAMEVSERFYDSFEFEEIWCSYVFEV